MSETATGPVPGDNQPDVFDLSMQLDLDVLRRRLEGAYQHRIDKTMEFLAGCGRFQEQIRDGLGDDAQAGRAGEFLKQLRDFIRLLDGERDAAKRPIDAASKLVQGFFRGQMIDLLAQGSDGVERAIASYNREKLKRAQQEREAEAERKRAAAALLAQEAEAISASVVDPAFARAATKLVSDQGVTTGTALKPWQVEIVDKAKIPLEYLMLNPAKAIGELRSNPALSKLGELTDGQQPIPGLRFFRETRIVTR